MSKTRDDIDSAEERSIESEDLARSRISDLFADGSESSASRGNAQVSDGLAILYPQARANTGSVPVVVKIG